MNLISDILFWISNGLLVPVVVLLIILFIRSLLLIGSFFGQYLAIRRTDALLRQQLDTLTIDTLPELEGKHHRHIKQIADHAHRVTILLFS